MFEQLDHESEWFSGDHHVPVPSSLGNLATETIDLNSLFATDVQSTGSFDLRSIESTSLGSLLNALPIPAVLVGNLYDVVFANQACRRITGDNARMHGVRFVDLLPSPGDTSKALALIQKAQSLLERAFETRQPQRAEAILKINQRKIWCRLHIRSVRMASQRYLLVLIEDLTSEKTQQRLSQREELRLKKAYHEVEHSLKQRTSEFHESRERLQEEASRLEKTKEKLRREKRKFQEFFRSIPLGMVLVGSDGTCRDLNPGFTEMFGHERDDIPFLGEWFRFQVEFPGGREDSSWRELLRASTEEGPQIVIVTARCKSGQEKKVRLEARKLDGGEHLITFQESPTIA